MNDRNDFEPSVRNSAWWASDTRQAANGRALDQILIKQGKQEAPDLSEVEAVQMGHVMQPTILTTCTERYEGGSQRCRLYADSSY